jgi:HK97 gp10 family phage protein
MAEEFNHFPEIRAKLLTAISQAVRKAAFDIQAQAEVLAPVQTSFLRNSIYVVTSDSSSYGDVQPMKADQVVLPEVEAPSSPTEAIVAVGASYGIYQEYGTVHIPAHPYLMPALDAVQPTFLAVLERLEDQLRSL